MYEGKKIAVAGFGEEGKSSLDYFKKHGAEVTVLDKNPDVALPAGVKGRTGDSYLDDLGGFDLVVRTPPLNPEKLKGANVTSQTRIFMEKCPAPVIGVTGTKGKGTTATLIQKALEAAGKKAWLAGNIGVPALDVLDDVAENDFVVFEMSSFQLWDLTISPHIAVVLPVMTDHLDVHTDREDYVTAKTNITAHQDKNDIAVYHVSDETAGQIASRSPGKRIAYLSEAGAYIKDGAIVISDNKICSIQEAGLIGPHNLENICAAVTASWQVTQDIDAIAGVVKGFKGLPHRLEHVAEIGGVDYYNDSFSASVPAAIAAIKSFEQPKVIIFGGSEKGVEYDGLADVVSAANIRKALLIGQTAPKLAAAFESKGFMNFERLEGVGMPEIVKKARGLAQEGDVVLLSPGCASFDMFENYKDRGEQFVNSVKRLK